MTEDFQATEWESLFVNNRFGLYYIFSLLREYINRPVRQCQQCGPYSGLDMHTSLRQLLF